VPDFARQERIILRTADLAGLSGLERREEQPKGVPENLMAKMRPE
jgi:hypothetical protein